MSNSAEAQKTEEWPLFKWRRAIMHSDLPAMTRLVLHTISFHMDMDGNNSFPSWNTIAKEAGISRATVGKHLNIAEEHGWLIRHSRGLSQSNLYEPSFGRSIKRPANELAGPANGSASPGNGSGIDRQVDTNSSILNTSISSSVSTSIDNGGSASPSSSLKDKAHRLDVSGETEWVFLGFDEVKGYRYAVSGGEGEQWIAPEDVPQFTAKEQIRLMLAIFRSKESGILTSM